MLADGAMPKVTRPRSRDSSIVSLSATDGWSTTYPQSYPLIGHAPLVVPTASGPYWFGLTNPPNTHMFFPGVGVIPVPPWLTPATTVNMIPLLITRLPVVVAVDPTYERTVPHASTPPIARHGIGPGYGAG